MPYTVTISKSTRATQDSGATVEDSITETETVTVSSKESVSATIPAAKDGDLTTRTDDDTGVVTFDSGHGFATNNVIDLFWSGGQRRAMTATVAGDAVTLDGGSGDVLPVVNTAVTGMVPTEIPFVVDGNTVEVLSLYSPRPGFIAFEDDLSAEINTAIYTFDAAGGQIALEPGGTNPLANTTTSVVKFSHNDSSQSRVMKAIAYTNEES